MLGRREWMLGAGALLYGACRTDPRWSRVTAEDETFTVLMPNRPRTSVQRADSVRGKLDTHFTTAIYRGTTFQLMWVDYPLEALVGTKKVLDYAVQGALYNSGAKLVEQHDIELNGFAGRELRAEGATGLPVWARIYLVGRRLFQLTVAGINRPASEENARKFLESFHIERELLLQTAPK